MSEAPLIDTTTRRMLIAHVSGASYRQLGAQFGMHHEQVRRPVLAEGTQLVNDVETSLYLAAKLESMGRDDEAAWPTFLVPLQQQGDWQVALELVAYVVRRLRSRDVLNLIVRTRPTPAGNVFQLILEDR